MIRQLRISAAEVEAFCRKWGIRKLEALGRLSASEGATNESIPFVITGEPETRWSLRDLVAMEEDLGRMLGRSVDLAERQCIANSRSYIRRQTLLGCSDIMHVS